MKPFKAVILFILVNPLVILFFQNCTVIPLSETHAGAVQKNFSDKTGPMGSQYFPNLSESSKFSQRNCDESADKSSLPDHCLNIQK